jgi:hypothetical protein
MARSNLPTTPKKLKQTTLFPLLESPTRSSPRQPASTSKAQTAVTAPKQKRKRADNSHPGGLSDSVRDESDSDLEAIHFEPKVNEVDEDELPVRSPTKKRKTRIVESDDDDDDEDDDNARHALLAVDSTHEEEGGSVHWRRRHKRKSRQVNDSDAEEQLQPRRRKLVKGIRPPSLSTGGESEHISDDVDEDREVFVHICIYSVRLIFSPHQGILENRLRTRGKKTAFQKNLEKLKRQFPHCLPIGVPDIDFGSGSRKETGTCRRIICI